MKCSHHFFNLFYPNHCICCDETLLDQEKIICLGCRTDLPFVDNRDFKSNPLTQVLEGRIPIENAASFLFYSSSGKVKQLIHELKYKSKQEIGTYLGKWFGRLLQASNQFTTIDCIIPVPLHKKKLKKRGYNQLTKFGESLSDILQVPFKENIVERINLTNTQTLKKRLERFKNVDTVFSVSKPDLIEKNHILLIDDVVTTGATLEACSKELLKSQNIKISIATIALTE